MFFLNINLPGIDPTYNKDPIKDSCVSVSSCEIVDSSGFRNLSITGPDQLMLKPKMDCPMYTGK